jgi:fructosamine-3-kinase
VTRYLTDAVVVESLTGGYHHGVWLATQRDGSLVVVKETPGAPPGMFQAEAEGLRVLRDSGMVGAPQVVDAADGHLVLERLNPLPPDATDGGFWERAGRALARLHGVEHDRFGWHADNWLGPTRQVNTWADDGREFFATNRILRYLAEPATEAALDAEQRAGIERICARLPELVPPARPALTHGDLWRGNMLTAADGSLALVDPAVSWNLPGTDTSMLLYSGSPPPARFFDAYHEIRPAEPGWRDHLRVLHLRELLCLLTQGQAEVAGRVQMTLDHFR